MEKLRAKIHLRSFDLLDVSWHYTWCSQLLPCVQASDLPANNNDLFVLFQDFKRGDGLCWGRGYVGTFTHQKQFANWPVLMNSSNAHNQQLTVRGMAQ